MGNFVTHADNIPAEPEPKKRKIEEVEDKNDSLEQKDILNTPKRRKLKSTSRYIYETLFVQGENSDVTIVALGKNWPLHKIYLCQSSYFGSMFSGAWKESKADIIEMDIPDEHIDEEALNIAFGSLYQDDVSITPSQVTRVLAAATLLGLDGLIQQCSEIMTETISGQTVCCYHAASVTYALQLLTDQCIDWLEKNLMTAQTVDLLKEINPDLMASVVLSSRLIVIQVEMDIYTLLKKWMFLCIHPEWQGGHKELTSEAEDFYKRQRCIYNRELLLTSCADAYEHIFRGLRLSHIINDFASTLVIESDKIIPKDWLTPVYRQQWLQMLRVEQGTDKGPEEIEQAICPQRVLRVGRVLQKDAQYCWRWTGYNYGLDILVSFTNRLITFKRNTYGLSSSGAVSMAQRRHILYRLTVCSLDSQGQTKYHKTTGLKTVSLAKDEEVVIIGVDRNVNFPIHISANFLFYTPYSGDKVSDMPHCQDSQPDMNTTSSDSGSTEYQDAVL